MFESHQQRDRESLWKYVVKSSRKSDEFGENLSKKRAMELSLTVHGLQKSAMMKGLQRDLAWDVNQCTCAELAEKIPMKDLCSYLPQGSPICCCSRIQLPGAHFAPPRLSWPRPTQGIFLSMRTILPDPPSRAMQPVQASMCMCQLRVSAIIN